MKKDTLIFILSLGVLIASMFLYNAAPLALHTDMPDTSTDSEESVGLHRMCYLQHITTEAGSDDTYLEASLNDDGTASGVFNTIPAEKDRLMGTFSGNWVETSSSSASLHVTYTYVGEGKTIQERRVFTVSPDGAAISYDEGKTFPQVLPRVDCESVPENVI